MSTGNTQHVASRLISGVPVDCGPPGAVVASIDARVSRAQVCLGYVNTHTAYLLARDGAYRSCAAASCS